MASVTISWSPADDQNLEVEVECDEGRPDVLDELTHRAVELFAQALGSVTTPDEG